MRVTRVLDTVYESKVGWNPSTGAIKPVHIANGLFRELTHRHYDTEDVVAFAVPGKKGEAPMPARTFEAMVLNCDDSRFKEFASPALKARFERLREAVRGVLAADKAVFPRADGSALTLTCPQMISADEMDKKVGKFMAALLRGPDADDELGALGRLMLERVGGMDDGATPQDPISFLVWPLLKQEPKKRLERDKARCLIFEAKPLAKFAEHLVAASDALAAHEAAQGNRLATLQRGVQFVCLAVLGHAQALAAGGRPERRTPLLLAAAAPKGSRLARASELSLLRYYEAFETWLGLQLGERIKKGQPVSTARDTKHSSPAVPAPTTLHRGSVKAWLKTFADEKGNAPDSETLENRMALFEEALAEYGRDNIPDVLGTTLASCYYDEYSGGGPRPFLQGIGKQIGLIFPHGSGRSQEKRVRPSVQTLDVLVKACTPTDRSIPVDEFLMRLWERFGIVVQGELGDGLTVHERLVDIGIDVSPTDLKENRDALIEHLVDIGLARRYPDNVAYVGRFNA